MAAVVNNGAVIKALDDYFSVTCGGGRVYKGLILLLPLFDHLCGGSFTFWVMFQSSVDHLHRCDTLQGFMDAKKMDIVL